MSRDRPLDLSNIHVGSLLESEIDPKNWRESSLGRVLYQGKTEFFSLPPGTTSDDFEEAAIDYYGAYSDAVIEDAGQGWIRVELMDPLLRDKRDEKATFGNDTKDGREANSRLDAIIKFGGY